MLLLLSQDLEALNERQTGVEHDRELPGEDRHPLGVDPARELGQELELLAFLADRGDVDLLTA